MQKNYFLFPLKSEALIKDYVREYLKDSNKDPIYAMKVQLPKDILEIINIEMLEYGLPKIGSSMAFKRKNDYTTMYNKCHIDYAVHKAHYIKSSIVIPIDGCEDTVMYWADGDFTTSVSFPSPKFPHTYPYIKILWNSPGTIIDQVEISNGPMLCRVDVPHNATSRKDGSYRLVMTLRFEENLSIEEIMACRNSIPIDNITVYN